MRDDFRVAEKPILLRKYIIIVTVFAKLHRLSYPQQPFVLVITIVSKFYVSLTSLALEAGLGSPANVPYTRR